MADSKQTATAEAGPKQDYGTIWVQDINGVSQMVRVVQVTPTKGSAAAGAAASAAVRAVVRPPAAAPPDAGPAACRPLIQVVQRPLQPEPPPAARSEPSATVVTNSPAPRLQMQDVQLVVQRTPGNRSAQSALQPSPTARSGGRPLLPGPGEVRSPATPASGRASPPGPLQAGAAKRSGEPPQLWSDSKRRRYERNAKGLRHFSMKVCQKVREKGSTTYNEVADELVAELCPSDGAGGGGGSSPDQQYEQKNIRRRVYDALNVLMAMEIISKERKQIKWLGLRTTPAQDSPAQEQEKADCRQRIAEKTQQLKDLVLGQVAFRNLVERNKVLEERHGPPKPDSSVQLPFIVVNTNKKTVIDCSISNDKKEYLFKLSDSFEMHDDIEVLKWMGMTLGLDSGTCSQEDVEKAKSMVTPSLAPFIDEVAREAADEAGGAEPGGAAADSLDWPHDEPDQDDL